MKKRYVQSASLITAAILLAACGGGGSSPAPAPTGAGTPNAAAAPAPATGSAATPAPAAGSAPATGAAPAPGASPIAGPAPSPSQASTASPVPLASLQSPASLAPGLQSGGTAAKTPSGYSDALLSGRWKTDFGDDACFPLPASLSKCAGDISFGGSLGFTASGNAATRVRELVYYRGLTCAVGSAVATLRSAEDIAFDAADVSLADDTVRPAGGTIAVRQGVVTAERFAISDEATLNGLFAGCPSSNPTTAGAPPPAQTCSATTLQLRIEQSPTATPLLLIQENVNCQPGTAVPPTKFDTAWNLTQSAGLAKLP